jgi:hypothetical protein
MRTVIALGMLVVMVGCEGDGRPSISTTQDNVCDEVAEVACYNMYQCCSESEIEKFLLVSDPRTEEQCKSDVHTICERQLTTIDFSLKNKRIRFDEKIMNTCLEAFIPPDRACTTVSSMKPWTEACMQSAFIGTVSDGGQCDFPDECKKDSFCTSSRVCAALPGDGMACSAQGCASGLYCGLGTCHPLLGAGGLCTSTLQCEEGLFCDTTAATRTCTPRHAIGEQCTGNLSCESNTCLPGTCAGTGNTCFTNTTCSNHCADDNSFCFTDGDCMSGTCSGTGTLCSTSAGCGAGDTCVFPVKCLPPQCVGDVVCADAHTVVDYCRDALTDLPLF